MPKFELFEEQERLLIRIRTGSTLYAGLLGRFPQGAQSLVENELATLHMDWGSNRPFMRLTLAGACEADRLLKPAESAFA